MDFKMYKFQFLLFVIILATISEAMHLTNVKSDADSVKTAAVSSGATVAKTLPSGVQEAGIDTIEKVTSVEKVDSSIGIERTSVGGTETSVDTDNSGLDEAKEIHSVKAASEETHNAETDEAAKANTVHTNGEGDVNNNDNVVYDDTSHYDDVVYNDYLDDAHIDEHNSGAVHNEEIQTMASAHAETATHAQETTSVKSTTTSTATSTTTTTTTTATPTTTTATTTTKSPTTTTTTTKPIGSPEPLNEDDVDPLGIFVEGIKFQRFPTAMKMSEFREKVLGKKYKKLYILEEAPDQKLFGMVRQLETVYFMRNESLYVDFLFRFIFSRRCTEIQKYRLGDKSGDEQYATFEKETKDNKTERLVFFSDYPSEYLYLMSCTDMKTSPYACRDSFYVSLESSRDPPNSFKWLEASIELKNKMNLTFDDPRFMFNFVMTPCVWKDDD